MNDNKFEIAIIALNKIAEWKLPETEIKDEYGALRSYEGYYGSNGARDYIKSIAKEALKKLLED